MIAIRSSGLMAVKFASSWKFQLLSGASLHPLYVRLTDKFDFVFNHIIFIVTLTCVQCLFANKDHIVELIISIYGLKWTQKYINCLLIIDRKGRDVA